MAARDPLGRNWPVDITGDFAPLGMRLRLESNSPDVLKACRLAFGRYEDREYGPRRPRFTIRLLVDPAFTKGPPWPEPVFRGQGSLFYICVGSQNTAVADLDRRLAIGFVSPSMAEDAGFLRTTFLECLAFTMATHGRGASHSYIHASAVAKEGKGFIFSGPRESGKSTLAFACARRGFQIVADDVVYLKAGTRGLTAWGKPWRLRFLPDCVRFFPELSGKAPSLISSSEDVIEIDVEEFLPGATRAHCVPAALFFLDRSGGTPACEPLDPGDAIKLLARDLIHDAGDVMERHLRTWSQLAGQGSYLLHYGTDLDAVVHFLERFLRAHPID